jgi:hypothetical protein
MANVSGDNGGWPDLDVLTSEEGRVVRKALVSLGGQQLEILGGVEGIRQKLDGVEIAVTDIRTDINGAVTDIRAEQRSEFKGVRQQLNDVRQQMGANHKAIESLNERIGVVGKSANDTREIVDSMKKLLKQLQVTDRFVSTPPPPGTTEAPPSIPPPLTLDSHFDFERTPMGGIKLDQKAQAILAQRMAKLEEERRIADAVAAERANIIATQKREAEEQRLAAERKEEQAKKDKRDQDALDIQKSAERRARLTAYVAAGVTLGTMVGGAIVWVFQVLHHH